MKNANMTGTVYKIPGRRRKPYTARITVGWTQLYNDDGTPRGKPKQKRKYLGTYATKKEATKALIAYSERLSPSDGESTVKHKEPLKFVPTFAQMWSDVKQIRCSQLAQTTMTNYENCYRRCEAIQNMRIDDITYKDLQLVMNKYMDEKHPASVLKLMKVFMTLVFSEAVKAGYIPSSPAQYVTYKGTKEKKVKRAIPERVIRKIDSCTEARTHDAVMILIYTGMRIDELLKLKKKNVHSTYIIAGEKTEAGKNRIIPLHPYIRDTMKRFLSSKHIGYVRFSECLKDDCKNYYGYSFTAHECRHTFITLANKYGLDLYALKRIVGHATRDVTEAVYTHIVVDTLLREIEKIPEPSKL